MTSEKRLRDKAFENPRNGDFDCANGANCCASSTRARWVKPQPTWLLRVTLNDDDGVIGVDDDRVMRTAPLGVVSGAVVGVVTGCPSG